MMFFGTIATIKALRGFEELGHLIRALNQNLLDITSFMILMIVMISGLSVAF